MTLSHPWLQHLLNLGIFVVLLMLSFLGGRLTPFLMRSLAVRLLAKGTAQAYIKFTEPVRGAMRSAATAIFAAFSLNVLAENYPALFQFLQFIVYFAVAVTLAWLFSRLARQFIRTYLVKITNSLGQEVNDLVLAFETITNFIIGFFAMITFAQSQNLNLLALLTGVGIGGVAIAFAAQETLGQLIGTIVIYLDRPYRPGEYIRVNFNIQDEDVYGRIESIGIRSTKIRVVAKNTLVIAPNSVMAAKDIENISRGTKVMVLFYLDFRRILLESEEALVEQVVQNATNHAFGIDPGSTIIDVAQNSNSSGTRVRISFFIMGASDDALGLRKQTLEYMNTTIAENLRRQNLDFDLKEPTTYVDSPITL